MSGGQAAPAGSLALPPLAAKILLSASAASVAETATYPLDLLKTRLQLQGELQSGGRGASGGLLRTALQVVRSERLRGLYTGLSPAMLRHLPYTGGRVVLFEQLRDRARRWHGLDAQPQCVLPLPSSLAIGLAAGALGQTMAVPADLIKVRMQADGRRVAAGQLAAPRYRGVLHALRSIVAEQGGAGLWRGSAPAIQRAALVNLGELTTYDQAKRLVVRSGITGGDNAGAHAASSACSGLVASLLSTPADVVKTRMMNQDPRNPTYRGSVDCLVRTLRSEGWRGLYKGFLPTWARLAPWQLAFWTSYEQIRRLGGLQPF